MKIINKIFIINKINLQHICNSHDIPKRISNTREPYFSGYFNDYYETLEIRQKWRAPGSWGKASSVQTLKRELRRGHSDLKKIIYDINLTKEEKEKVNKVRG